MSGVQGETTLPLTPPQVLARLLTVDGAGSGIDADFVRTNTITGASGTVALGGFTLTVPATGTAMLLSETQTVTGAKTFSAVTNFSNTDSGISPTTGSVISAGTIVSTQSAAAAPMFSGFHISADASSEGLRLYKRGAVGDATAAIASGAEIGYHSFYAWNGSAYGRGAYVLVSSREAFGGSAYGTEYAIFAAPTGSTVPVRAVQVWGTQVICGIGRLQISSAFGGSGANWLQYTESGVADRWSVGTKSGDAALYWNQGLNGAGTDRMSLSSAGTLTLPTATGTTLAISSTTDSTSKDTGSIVTEGGLGVERAVVAGTGFGMGEAPAATSSPFTAVGTVNGGLYYRIKNGSNGASAQADFRAFNDGDQFIQFGIASSGKTTYGSIIANRSFLYCFNAAGLTLMCDNASGPIVFSSGGNSEKARFSAAGNLLLGTTSDAGITGAGGLSAVNDIRTGGRIGLAQVAGTTVDGDTWHDSTQKALQTYVNGIEQTLSGCIFTQTATQTIANTTTETSLFSTGVGTRTLPANFFLAGKTIRLVLTGSFTDTGTPTVRLRLKYGATTIIDGTALTIEAVAGTEEWRAVCELTCRTAGVSGVIAGDIWFGYDTTVAGGDTKTLNIPPTTATVDTTASGALDLTFEWGTASASNSISAVLATVEVLN